MSHPVSRRITLRFLPLLLAGLFLAGCDGMRPAPGGARPEGAITETVLAAPGADSPAAATGQGAPESPGPSAPAAAVEPTSPGAQSVPAPEAAAPVVVEAPPPPPDPPFIAQQRHLCERGGGRLTPRGPGAYACVRTTRDSGRRCESSTQCEGVCLARSNTCAPFQPLYGCHDVWQAPGVRVTQCME